MGSEDGLEVAPIKEGVMDIWHKAPKGIAPIGLLAFLQRLGHHPQDPGSLDTWMLAVHDVAKVGRHLHGDQHPPAPDPSSCHLKPDHRNGLPLLPWKVQASPVDLELVNSLRDALA